MLAVLAMVAQMGLSSVAAPPYCVANEAYIPLAFRLRERYLERFVGVVLKDGMYFRLFVSKRKRTFSVVYVAKNGNACVYETGLLKDLAKAGYRLARVV